jgi:hypothetical protein
MANDGSLGGSVTLSMFDLQSEQGAANLLASVRASKILPEQKNELRDLIFQYMNGGQEQTIRIALEQKINKYNIVPKDGLVNSGNNYSNKPLIQHPFGTSRPTPNFIAPQPSLKVSELKPIVTPKVIPETPPPTPPVPEPRVVMQEPLKPAQTVMDASPAQTPVETEIKTETKVEVDSSAVIARNLDRIKEIKAQINEKVGNPVNLVDIDNDMGREYMSAMLDAMKKINSGVNADSAMERLELAYISVVKALAEHNRGVSGVATETPTPVATSVASTIPEPMVVAPQTVFNNPVSTPTWGSSDTKPVMQQVQPEVTVPVPPRPSVVVEAHHIPVTGVPVPPTPPAPPAPPAPPVPPIPQATATLRQAATGAHSLAESQTKLRKPEDLPLASSLEDSSVTGDPLFTKDVDEGLQQLLSEWSLFKKSGLFGTGPKGINHPLFKSISTLQVPLLLAGRFEGATQEIKQSITDYMNGWRYEQGIIYQQGENFEHYLRRVIRHIIDLQKRNRPS